VPTAPGLAGDIIQHQDRLSGRHCTRICPTAQDAKISCFSRPLAREINPATKSMQATLPSIQRRHPWQQTQCACRKPVFVLSRTLFAALRYQERPRPALLVWSRGRNSANDGNWEKSPPLSRLSNRMDLWISMYRSVNINTKQAETARKPNLSSSSSILN